MVHLIDDNVSGNYTESLVNVIITVDSVVYRYYGFLTAEPAG
jgi:hypothetical protein